MVFLAFGHEQSIEILNLAKTAGCAVWLWADSVTDSEYEKFGSEGVKVSRFIYPFSEATAERVSQCLDTIEQHHPGESIWVQHRSPDM